MNIENVITRLERAGGAMSEASQVAEQVRADPEFVSQMVLVNIALGDLRSAAVKIANGEDPGAVVERLKGQLRENFN